MIQHILMILEDWFNIFRKCAYSLSFGEQDEGVDTTREGCSPKQEIIDSSW